MPIRTSIVYSLERNDDLFFSAIESVEQEFMVGDNNDYVGVESKNQYSVTFVDWDGTLFYVLIVEEGDAAIAPEPPEREGYTFIGWDTDFSNTTSDITVTALYEKVNPAMSEDANGDGTVNAQDALFVLRCSLCFTTLPCEENICDVNSDGRVNAQDALLIIRFALGLISSI